MLKRTGSINCKFLYWTALGVYEILITSSYTYIQICFRTFIRSLLLLIVYVYEYYLNVEITQFSIAEVGTLLFVNMNWVEKSEAMDYGHPVGNGHARQGFCVSYTAMFTSQRMSAAGTTPSGLATLLYLWILHFTAVPASLHYSYSSVVNSRRHLVSCATFSCSF